jgi:tetratricopeptide (TPR) repeat protein
MAADRESSFSQAERLLRQGKVQPALEELERIITDNPRDLLSLNRCGDLLARTGHRGPAIGYYERLADKYAQSGFVPKAIAIYKKALRLEAELPRVFVKLGELYMAQQHTGEARAYLLRAAEGHLSEHDFEAARKVYDRLVEAEPDDPRHRVRLAETRAAEGETDEAAAELVALGDTLLDAGRTADAEKAFERAGELLPDSFDAAAGRALSLAAQGRHDDAITSFEQAKVESAAGSLVGVRAILFELGGRGDEAARSLAECDAPEAYEVFVQRFLRLGDAAGGAQTAWARLDDILASRGDSEEVFELLDRLGRVEKQGHLPALERLCARRKEQGDRDATIRALEHLIRVLQARSMTAEAERYLEELRGISPGSAMLESEAPQPAAPPGESKSPPGVASRPVEVAESPAAIVDHDEATLTRAEAPAVPLSPADEEFVSGHLTEAEVLQKYGLASEALQRLRTVTGRFPGHVEAQTRLAALIRSQGDREELAEVLVQLALAQRAAGETDVARDAAREAAERGSLPEDQVALLTRMGLLESAAPVPATAGAPHEAAATTAPLEQPATPASPSVPVEAPTSVEQAPAAGGGEEVEIVFGNAPAEAPPVKEAGPSAEEGQRIAPPDLLEEIAFYRDQGMLDEARSKLTALKTLGYTGAAMAELESELRTPVPDGTAPTTGSEPEASDLRLDDSDFSDLAAALEAELPEGVEVEGEGGDGAAGEESLEEVFEAFKRQVEDEVGSEDYRTHYDLGIAYKEMGLLDDALKEFEIATSSSELFRESCSMLALCQRQRGELGEAVQWYRKAIEAPGGTSEELQGLRYDLAEALLQQGDDRGALDLFRNILDADPGYRDVQSRVTEIRSRLGE